MVAVLGLAGVIWAGGHLIGVPRGVRAGALAALFLAVVAVQITLPEGHALRAATGGGAAPWLVLGMAMAAVGGYRAGLGALHRRAAAHEGSGGGSGGNGGTFSPAELERYARHIVLREIGGPGQKRLKQARVLVIGAGGLGSPALMYLAAAGVGRIGVIDDDIVDAANLQRQIIHTDARIGMAKVFSAEQALRALNPHVEIRPYNRRLSPEIAQALLAEHDLVLDGSDNFTTRYLVNRAAVHAGVPLIGAALTQWEGQISLYDPAHGTPCYQCVFPEQPAAGLAPACAEAGVAGPLPGILGAMMAMEAVKQITGAGATLAGRMLIHDALFGESRTIALAPRAGCPVCAGVQPPPER